MVKKNSTMKKPCSRRAPSPAAIIDYDNSPVRESVETERSRLMAADSVLACAQTAMDPQADNPGPEPYLPAVLAIARKLFNKSTHRLDCVELDRRARKTKK